VALLAQFLVCFGTAIGRTAHYAVEASRHFGNKFVVLIGPSSKWRKSSSWDHVERVMAKVDLRFIDDCIDQPAGRHPPRSATSSAATRRPARSTGR
jgi:hypothetical protein